MFAFFRKNKKQKKQLLYTAVFILFIFSNNSLFHLANTVWSKKAIKLPQNTTYTYAIIPGGMANFDDKVKRIRFSASADRLFQAIYLYKNKKVKNLIISGGSGNILYPELRESEIIRSYLIRIGIPSKNILIENKSKNTYENALFTANVLKEKNFSDSCLLITSAMHIRRAEACFKKAGIKVKPYPVSQILDKYRYSPDNLFIPNAEALNSWQQLIHEIAGYIVYWLRGYI
jgi:uncharacterized SAM-binding protein YcdF (DUF218 family)